MSTHRVSVQSKDEKKTQNKSINPLNSLSPLRMRSIPEAIKTMKTATRKHINGPLKAHPRPELVKFQESPKPKPVISYLGDDLCKSYAKTFHQSMSNLKVCDEQQRPKNFVKEFVSTLERRPQVDRKQIPGEREKLLDYRPKPILSKPGPSLIPRVQIVRRDTNDSSDSNICHSRIQLPKISPMKTSASNYVGSYQKDDNDDDDDDGDDGDADDTEDDVGDNDDDDDDNDDDSFKVPVMSRHPMMVIRKMTSSLSRKCNDDYDDDDGEEETRDVVPLMAKPMRSLKNAFNSFVNNLRNTNSSKNLPKGTRAYYSTRESLGDEMYSFRQNEMSRMMKRAGKKFNQNSPTPDHHNHRYQQQMQRHHSDMSHIFSIPKDDESPIRTATIRQGGSGNPKIRYSAPEMYGDNLPSATTKKVQPPAAPFYSNWPIPRQERSSMIDDLGNDANQFVQLRRCASSQVVYDVPRIMRSNSELRLSSFAPNYENVIRCISPTSSQPISAHSSTEFSSVSSSIDSRSDF